MPIPDGRGDLERSGDVDGCRGLVGGGDVERRGDPERGRDLGQLRRSRRRRHLVDLPHLGLGPPADPHPDSRLRHDGEQRNASPPPKRSETLSWRPNKISGTRFDGMC
jgi:hypothetical protein